MGSGLTDDAVNFGLFKVGVVVFGLVAVLAAVNVILMNRSQDSSVGYWVQAWARRYPAFAFAISFFFGAMIGHFFWDTWSPI